MIREACKEDSTRIAEIYSLGRWSELSKLFFFKVIIIKLFLKEIFLERIKKNFLESFTCNKNYLKTYVFEEDNIIKAFMIIGNYKDEDKKDESYNVLNLYVDTPFQRQNIGKKLMEYCVQMAENNNKTEINLCIFEKNKSAIKFFKKIGFKLYGNKYKNIILNVNEIKMVKTLYNELAK